MVGKQAYNGWTRSRVTRVVGDDGEKCVLQVWVRARQVPWNWNWGFQCSYCWVVCYPNKVLDAVPPIGVTPPRCIYLQIIWEFWVWCCSWKAVTCLIIMLNFIGTLEEAKDGEIRVDVGSRLKWQENGNLATPRSERCFNEMVFQSDIGSSEWRRPACEYWWSAKGEMLLHLTK